MAADEDELRKQLERLEKLPNSTEGRSLEYERLLDFLQRTIE